MFSVLLIPFLAAMFLAINMGGSGTSPSFSAAYGANIIRKDLIPGLFGLFVFFGAILAGKKVVSTIGKDILPGEAMGLALITIILLSVGLSLLLANLLKVPQSTSQSTIFALIGPAVYFDILKTEKLFYEILPTWFVLPIVSFAITLFVGKFIFPLIRKRQNVTFEKIPAHPVLKIMVIVTACYVAFAIGSNNVANAAGPLASMISNELNIVAQGEGFTLIMILATLIIAPCFAIGSSLFGKNVVETTGKGITAFGPSGAILISSVTGTLLLLASLSRGIPMSLVQMNTAAIIGLGISQVGWKEMLAHTTVRKILTIWIVAPLISLLLSFLFTTIADKAGLL